MEQDKYQVIKQNMCKNKNETVNWVGMDKHQLFFFPNLAANTSKQKTDIKDLLFICPFMCVDVNASYMGGTEVLTIY